MALAIDARVTDSGAEGPLPNERIAFDGEHELPVEMTRGRNMQRVVNRSLMSGAALAIVIAALVLFDVRVRQAFADLVVDAPSSELAQAGSGLYELGTVVLTAVHDQSIANAPLMIFVVIATVLMLFMVRT